MSRYVLLSAVAATAVLLPTRSVANPIDPATLDFFASIGIFLDEAGAPVPPPVAPALPALIVPPDPVDADEALALFLEQIGLTLDEDGNPVPHPLPIDTPPRPPVEPLTPEELAELLGLPVDAFLVPEGPAEPLPQPGESELVLPVQPGGPVEYGEPDFTLDDFLGEAGVLIVGEPPELPPVLPAPAWSDASFLALLGIDPAVFANGLVTTVPEPVSAALLAFAALTTPRRRSR